MKFTEKETTRREIWRVDLSRTLKAVDVLATEEPLEIKLAFGPRNERRQESIAVTMRTPGYDFDLALGFLFTEGIITGMDEVINLRYQGELLSPESAQNIVLVELSPDVSFDTRQLSRHFYTSSSCGICGKASIDLIRTTILHHPAREHPLVHPDTIRNLPDHLRDAQAVFECTGGIHASGLFDKEGHLLLMREDVGRHNALDKLIGGALQKKAFPLGEQILLVSGRISFELVQKALMAGIPILAGVGAPSSLAVELADEYGMTVIGFLKEKKFNLYCGSARLVLE